MNKSRIFPDIIYQDYQRYYDHREFMWGEVAVAKCIVY